jgi:PadR family transcriptional regulator PadR
MYGYEIIQELDVLSDGYYKLKEGTLYPVLYRLEDSGWIESNTSRRKKSTKKVL